MKQAERFCGVAGFAQEIRSRVIEFIRLLFLFHNEINPFSRTAYVIDEKIKC